MSPLLMCILSFVTGWFGSLWLNQLVTNWKYPLGKPQPEEVTEEEFEKLKIAFRQRSITQDELTAACLARARTLQKKANE